MPDPDPSSAITSADARAQALDQPARFLQATLEIARRRVARSRGHALVVLVDQQVQHQEGAVQLHQGGRVAGQFHKGPHRAAQPGPGRVQAAGQCDTRAAQLLLRDVLPGRFPDHRWSGGEDRAEAAHDPEVAHGGDQGAMPGRGAQHGGHGGHQSRAAGLPDEVDGRASTVGPRPKARSLQQHHQRDLVADRQLGDPVALGVAAGPDGARGAGEVLGAHHYRCAVDRPGTRHDAVGGHVARFAVKLARERGRFVEPLPQPHH